jgi:hypothetical protein
VHRNPFIKSTNIRHIQGAAHRNLYSKATNITRTQGAAHRNPYTKSTSIWHIQGAAHRNLYSKATNITRTQGAAHRNLYYPISVIPSLSKNNTTAQSTSSKKSNKYSGLKATSFFLSISRYSSLNDDLAWCFS